MAKMTEQMFTQGSDKAMKSNHQPLISVIKIQQRLLFTGGSANSFLSITVMGKDEHFQPQRIFICHTLPCKIWSVELLRVVNPPTPHPAKKKASQLNGIFILE